MKTYKDVKAQIEALEKTAEALRQRELKAVTTQLRNAIAEYGLSAADLGFGASVASPVRKPVARKSQAAGKTRTVGAAKYRDPATQKTWTGRGKPPGWIVGVKDRGPYLIDAPAAAPTPAAKPAAKAAKPAAKAAKGAGKAGKGAKPAAAKKKAGRKGGANLDVVKSPAVQIEGGAASQ